MAQKDHWETVYRTKDSTQVSWFQEHAQLSLELLRSSGIPHAASVIDVGGGASTLVDDMLADGYQDMTVLDLSAAALATAQARLGKEANGIQWLEANVLEAEFGENSFDLWHDRAVFHFLTSENERKAYVRQVLHAVKPGGTVIVATFAEDGPTKCSGLPVMRYSVEGLHAELGQSFQLVRHAKEMHRTPDGSEQKFVYCVFKAALDE